MRGRRVHEGHAVDVVPAVGGVDAAVQALAVVAERASPRRRPARCSPSVRSSGSRPRAQQVDVQRRRRRAGARAAAAGLRSRNVVPPPALNRIVVTEREGGVVGREVQARRRTTSTVEQVEPGRASVCWRLWKGFVTPPTLCRGTPGSRMGKGRRIPPPRGDAPPYRVPAGTTRQPFPVLRRPGCRSVVPHPSSISGRKWLDVTNRSEPGPRPGFAHHHAGARPRAAAVASSPAQSAAPTGDCASAYPVSGVTRDEPVTRRSRHRRASTAPRPRASPATSSACSRTASLRTSTWS